MRLNNEPSMLRALELFVWIACTYFSIRFIIGLGD